MAKTKKNADQTVLELLSEVRDRQAKLQKAKAKPNWKTNTTLGTSEESVHDRVNIQTVTKPEKLVNLYTFLLNKEKEWQQANDELGLNVSAKWQGYDISDWKDDLKTRAAQLTVNEKERELETLEKRLDGLITVEQRRELDLAAIQNQLQKQ